MGLSRIFYFIIRAMPFTVTVEVVSTHFFCNLQLSEVYNFEYEIIAKQKHWDKATHLSVV